jgi:hypothetical protein
MAVPIYVAYGSFRIQKVGIFLSLFRSKNYHLFNKKSIICFEKVPFIKNKIKFYFIFCWKVILKNRLLIVNGEDFLRIAG